MDKIAMNNQIVVMRHAVRKARVAVATKLIREMKLLNARKHGNEKVIEKCKRKAGKLTKEMKTLKKLKDDDISKFAITNTRDKHLVLADSSVGTKTRVMIRLAFHKSLNAEVVKFRETFSDYQMYFDSEKKIKRKGNGQNRTNGIAQRDETENDISAATSINVPNDVNQDEFCCDSEIPDCPDHALLDSEGRQFMMPEIVTEGNKNKKKMAKHSVKYSSTITVDPNQRDSPTVKIVSKLATVKRFYVADDTMENIGTPGPITDDAESQDDIMQSAEEIDVFSTAKNLNSNYLNMTKLPSNSFNDVDRLNLDSNSTLCYHHSKDAFTNIDNATKRSAKLARNGNITNSRFPNLTDKQLYNNYTNRSRIDHIENGKTRIMHTNNKMCNENLHPSWAARKKQQDILKQGFQGKKIVFSDD